MIIDTTCSVIERKMKEVYTREQSLDHMLAEEPQLIFKVSDFVVNTSEINNITITTGPAPAIFDCEVVSNTNAIFNDCVIHNQDYHVVWSNIPKKIKMMNWNWSTPISKPSPLSGVIVTTLSS